MENTAPNGTRYLMIGLILGALIAILLLKSCQPEQPQIAKGTFKPVKPIHTTQIDTIYKNSTRILYKENRVLDSIFINSTDTVKVEIYRDAISINQFNHTFKDCTATINAIGLVRGSVESLAIDYKLKLIPQKKPVFRLLAGAELGMTKSFDKTNVKANLGLQFKNGSIVNISADSEQRFYVGYSVKVFEVQR